MLFVLSSLLFVCLLAGGRTARWVVVSVGSFGPIAIVRGLEPICPGEEKGTTLGQMVLFDGCDLRCSISRNSLGTAPKSHNYNIQS